MKSKTYRMQKAKGIVVTDPFLISVYGLKAGHHYPVKRYYLDNEGEFIFIIESFNDIVYQYEVDFAY